MSLVGKVNSKQALQGVLAIRQGIDGKDGEKGEQGEVSLAYADSHYSPAIITSASGEVVATTDSAKAKTKNIRLYGKTEQDSTEGNQLFDGTLETLLGSTDGVIVVKGGIKSAVMPIIGGETYTVSILTSDTIFTCTTSEYPSVGTTIIDAYSGTAGVKVNQKTIKTSANAKYLVVGFGSIENPTDYGIMVNKGNTALPLEKFTGGEASPNMNYPQPLNSHGDSGNIENKLLSSNMLKYSYPIGYTVTKNGVTFTILEDGGISVVGTNEGNEVSFNFVINKEYFLPIGEYTIHAKGIQQNLMQIGTWGEDFKKFFNNLSVVFQKDMSFTGTFVEPTSPMVAIYVKANATVNTTIYMALNVGKEVQQYEPYTEQPFTVLTPNGLKGIPLGQTIPDVIKNSPIHMSGVYWDSATSQYYIGDTENEDGKDIQRIEKYTITGNEYWQAERGSYGGSLPQTLKSPSLFTHGIYNTHYTYDGTWFHWNGDASAWQTVEEWKKFIAGKTIYYVLPEPIVTETDSQHDVVMNYPNTTIINSDNAYMEVEYVADTKIYIDNKFKELAVAIVSQ